MNQSTEMWKQQNPIINYRIWKQDKTSKQNNSINLDNFLAPRSITKGDSNRRFNRRELQLDDPIVLKLHQAANYAALGRERDTSIGGRQLAIAWSSAPKNLVEYSKATNAKVDQTIFWHFQRVKKDVTNRIQTVLDEDQTINKIVFTGHFLRGALAILFALDTKNYLISKNLVSKYEIEVMTFGTPRIGNFQFAQYVNSKLQEPPFSESSNEIATTVFDKVFRVTHGESGFSQEPLNIGDKAGYFHHEREYWINPVISCDCGKEKVTGYVIFVCFGALNGNEKYFEEPEDCNKMANQVASKDPKYREKSLRNYFGNWM
ncbi:hypothetical protein G9A89_003952 [Geosiphon pyriformis]|nr:hypothetical protein G9A89_003952 [Geosiphon pyriformis]